MLTITIQLDPRDKNDTLDLHLEAIGFYRSEQHAANPLKKVIYKGQTQDLSTAGLAFVENPVSDDAEVEKAIIEETILASDDAIGGVGPLKCFANGGVNITHEGKSVNREPGKPAPGHRRRTNAEIAEDEAYFARAGKQQPVPVAETDLVGLTGGAETGSVSDASHAAEGASIFGDAGGSSDSYATAVSANPADTAQDAADEAAEAAATKTDVLTLDDLRNAAGAYQKAHGPLAAIKNIPIILGKPLTDHAPQEIEESIRKIRIATEAPAVTSAPVVQQHIEENKPAAPPTLDDVKAALGRYAAKYDGRTDLGKETTPITNEDGSKLVKQAVGADNLRDMPKDPVTLAKLIAAIDAAVVSNPFKREVKNG